MSDFGSMNIPASVNKRFGYFCTRIEGSETAPVLMKSEAGAMVHVRFQKSPFRVVHQFQNPRHPSVVLVLQRILQMYFGYLCSGS